MHEFNDGLVQPQAGLVALEGPGDVARPDLDAIGQRDQVQPRRGREGLHPVAGRGSLPLLLGEPGIGLGLLVYQVLDACLLYTSDAADE